MRTLNVDLGDRSYPIFIGTNLLGRSDLFEPYLCSSQVMLVSNTTVEPLYAAAVEQTLAPFNCDKVVLPDGEKYKNLDTLNLVFDGLLQKRHNRKTTILALGGGVVGDMAGFAAAAYQRGVNFIQVPTTLLSQVDSSVGGKTGVNHALGKNMIGAFYQPQAVIIDTDVLATLPDQELSAGIAEVIKYGLIADAPFFKWLESNMSLLVARDNDALAHAIEISCRTKADVVAQDEKESGIRAILNLGHTFGHAIEAHQNYTGWVHGQAVAVGMLMACDLSLRLGWIDQDLVARAEALIDRAKLPQKPPAGMTQKDFLTYMAVDKKVLDGAIRLVLLRACGKSVVTSDFDLAKLDETLDKYCH